MKKASIGQETQEKGMGWLLNFFKEINPLVSLRNQLLHLAKSKSKDDYRLVLLRHLYDGKLHSYQKQPDAVPWLEAKITSASEAGLEDFFPDIRGFWRHLEDVAVRAASKLSIHDMASPIMDAPYLKKTSL